MESLTKAFLVSVLLAATCWTVTAEESSQDDDKLYEETVVLKTRMGSLRGRREILQPETSDADGGAGRFYFAFKGIRYAKPPVNERRFQVIDRAP